MWVRLPLFIGPHFNIFPTEIRPSWRSTNISLLSCSTTRIATKLVTLVSPLIQKRLTKTKKINFLIQRQKNVNKRRMICHSQQYKIIMHIVMATWHAMNAQRWRRLLFFLFCQAWKIRLAQSKETLTTTHLIHAATVSSLSRAFSPITNKHHVHVY